jgi:hypothetical protein
MGREWGGIRPGNLDTKFANRDKKVANGNPGTVLDAKAAGAHSVFWACQSKRLRKAYPRGLEKRI